jgi:glycosyltransferase involved in cell wall biosynthesis
VGNVKVSVIVPSFNHAAYLKQRIDSILNQSFHDFELIILDDCSTDDSWRMIKSYSGHPSVTTLLQNEVNFGNTFLQWKKGINLAKGEYIWIAESDDFCDNNFLEVTSSLLDRNPDLSLVYCKSNRVDENGEYMDDLSHWYDDLSSTKWRSSYKNEGIDEIKRALCFKNTIPNASAVLFRKNKSLAISDDLFSYRLSGDWYFWIYLLEQGNIMYTNSTINYFRTHQKSIRSQEQKNNISTIEKKRILDYLLRKGHLSKMEIASLAKRNKEINPISLVNTKLISIVSNLLRYGS